MRNLLIVNTSPNKTASVTRALTATFAETWARQVDGGTVAERDLGETPPPHLDQDTIGAFYTPDDNRTPEQKLSVALSDTLVDEVRQADVIVIGAPMHNFGSPSSLKSYFDHIARVGETFVYTENGPKGLLEGKKVYVVTARGGNYAEGSPAAPLDNQEPYIRTFLGFIGITDVSFIHSQGLAMGEDVRARSIEAAETAIGDAVEDVKAA